MSTQRQTRHSTRNAAAKAADEASVATTPTDPTPATHGRGSGRGRARGAKAGAEPKIAPPGRLHKRALSPEAPTTEPVPKGPERLVIPKQKRSKVSSLH